MLVQIGAVTGVRDTINRMQKVDTDLQSEMMSGAAQELAPVWGQLLEQQVGLAKYGYPAQDRKVVTAGASTLVTATGFGVFAGESTVPLSGGLVPADEWYAVEFGARTRRVRRGEPRPSDKRVRRSLQDGPYRRNAVINRGLPGRQRYGRVGFAAASKFGRELVRVWVRTVYDLYEKATV